MFEQSRTYYLYSKSCDMRKSFNTLSGLVRTEMNLPVLSGAGFVFINKRRTHLKMLTWEGDGLSLYFKRLTKGTFEHPKTGQEYSISYENLLLVLRGISTEQIVKRRRYTL